VARIAIIGTGISGMGAAYLLHQAGHDICVYEKNAMTGGHTRTLQVDYDGVQIPVDTGFIVYNVPNYPNLDGMFRHLGVQVQKSDMSFALSIDKGWLEWGARSLNAVFGQRRNLLRPSFYRLIRDIMRFNAGAEALVAAEPQLTLGEMVQKMQLGDWFLRYYILPMGGAIWSCPPKAMLQFPALSFVQFFKNHALLDIKNQHQWYTVTGGSREYMAKLTASFSDRIRVNCGVASVTRRNGQVQVTDVTGETQSYDRVVFACHANETLAMLEDATSSEREVLGAFHYQKNMAYLHRDTRIMPKRRVCWASWVYHAQGQAAGDEPDIAVTYWMNLLQGIDASKPLFVTLNPVTPIDPALIFDTHLFEHPVFTHEAIAAQKRLPEIQGMHNSWFCGAYTRYGFHEDGLGSAVRVAELMGATIPWC
jgi:predicted NAD/FAD-binding protein